MNPHKNPYIGPRTFQREEGDLFYGREREARDLISLVASERLVVFYAQSGAGKSSIVNTRLVPNMENKEYEVLPVGRVSGDTAAGIAVDNIYIYNLIRSLQQHEIDPAELAGLSLPQFLCQLNFDEKGFFYDPDLAAEMPGDDNSSIIRRALVIDQFEELFSTHPEAWEKRDDFFRQLARAMNEDTHLWVVLVMREDYIAALDPYAYFMQGGLRVRYYMQRLGRDAALKAVTSPVEDFRPYAPGVAEKLIDDLCSIKVEKPDGELDFQPGQYVEPVQLQVVCYGLWENLSPEGTQITQQDLQDVGDVNQSLGKYYDKRVGDVARTKNARERLIREWFEKKLITAGGIRNMVLQERGDKPGELDDDVIQALQSDLVRAEKRGGATWYELTHDRLVEPILERNRAWFSENLSPLQRQAALWKDQDQNESWLLRDKALVEVEEWAKEHDDELTETEREFLAACQKAQAQIEERHAAERRQLEMATQLAEEQKRSAERSRRFNIVAIGLVIVATITTIFALFTRQDAITKQNVAFTSEAAAITAKADALQSENEAQTMAKIALSGDLISYANDYAKQSDLSTLLKIEAFRSDDNPRTRRSLLYTLQDFANLQSFILQPTDKKPAEQFGFSPDGKTLATLDEEGIFLWNLSTRKTINDKPLNGHFMPVFPIAFNADGRILASASKDGTVMLWDTATGRPLSVEPLSEHNDWIDSLAFHPTQPILASSSDDKTIILWDVLNPGDAKKIDTLTGHSGWIASVAFSPDGNLLASGSSDKSIILWDISNPREHLKLSTIKEHTELVSAVAFGKDNTILASASIDGTIMLWDISKPEKPKPYAAPITLKNENEEPLPFWALAFSPDGNTLAAGERQSITLWNVEDPSEPVMIGEPLTEYAEVALYNDYLYSLIFSPNGKTLAMSGCETELSYDYCPQSDIFQWDVSSLSNPRELGEPIKVRSRVNSLSYTHNGQTLAAGSFDGNVILWDNSDPRKPEQKGAPLKGHPGRPEGMSFSEDGSILLSQTASVTVLFDVATLMPIGKGEIKYQNSNDGIMVYQYYDEIKNEQFAQVVDTAAGKSLGAPIPGEYVDMSLSKKFVVYATAAAKEATFLNLWNLESGKPIKTKIIGSFAGFSPDDSIFVYENYDDNMGQNYIYLLDIEKASLVGSPVPGSFISLSPDNKVLLYYSTNTEDVIDGWDTVADENLPNTHIQGSIQSTSPDASVNVYQNADKFGLLDSTGKLIGDPVPGYSPFYFSEDGKILAYSTQDAAGTSQVALIDATTGIVITENPIPGNAGSWDSSGGRFFTFGADNQVLLCRNPDDGPLFLLDTTTGEAIGRSLDGIPVDFTPDGNALIYQDSSGNIGLLDLALGITIGVPYPGTSLGTASDNTRLVLLRENESSISFIDFIDLFTGQLTGQVSFRGSNPQYSSKGNLLASRDESSMINLWDLSRTWALGNTVESTAVPIEKAVFNPSATNMLVAINEDGIIRQDVVTGKPIGDPFNHHVGGVSSVWFGPGNQALLSVGMDGALILWSWDPDTNSYVQAGDAIQGTDGRFASSGNVLVIADAAKKTTSFLDKDSLLPVRNPVGGSVLATSPDENFLVIVDAENNLSTLWNLTTLARIDEPISGSNVRFDEAGKFVAISDSNSNTTVLVDLATTTRFGDHIQGNALLFSQDGTFLVTRDESSGSRSIWDLTKQKPKAINVKGESSFYADDTLFSPGGKFIFMMNYYDTRKEVSVPLLWDIANQKDLSLATSGSLTAFSKDDQFVAIYDDSTAKTVLWDAARKLKLFEDLDGWPVGFSIDARYLITQESANIFVWDLAEASHPRKIRKIPGVGVQPSPDGRYLALIEESENVTDARVSLWDLQDAPQRIKVVSGSINAFTSDGKYLIYTNNVLNVEDRSPIFEDETVGSYSIEYSPDQTLMAIYGSNGITVWDPDAQKIVGQELLGHKGHIDELVFSPDGKIVASLSSDGVILSDLFTGKKLDETIPGFSANFHPDGTIIAVGEENGKTSLWDISTAQSFTRDEESFTGGNGSFSPDGKYLATLEKDIGTGETTGIIIWDVSRRKRVIESIPGNNLQFSSDGKLLAVMNTLGSSGGKKQEFSISIWDMENFVQLGETPIESPCDSSNPYCISAAFSPDGQMMAYNDYSDGDAVVYLWDRENQSKLSRAPLWSPVGVQNLSFIEIPETNNILIVNGFGSFTIWDASLGTQLSQPIRGTFQASRRNPGGETELWFIDEYSHGLLAWDFNPDEWKQQLCEKTGRTFTEDEWNYFLPISMPYIENGVGATCP